MENSGVPTRDKISQGIKSEFQQLSSSQKRILVNELTFEQRRSLVEVILSSNKEHVSHSGTQLNHPSSSQSENEHRVMSSIIEKIKLAKKTHPELTKSSDRRSLIDAFIKDVKIKRDDLAYVFNILTADKTDRVLKESLIVAVHDKKEESISSKGLKKLIQEARKNNPTEIIKLSDLLKSNSYSMNVSKLSFSNELDNVDFGNITFDRCTFASSNFSKTKLDGVFFDNCDFSGAYFGGEISDSLFNNCEMREVMFTGADLDNVKFLGSSLICCSFEDAALSKGVFVNCIMPGTHFLEATINARQFHSQNLIPNNCRR